MPEIIFESDIPTSFDQLIKIELNKFDVVVPAVAELSNEFLPLKIESIDDNKGYAEVSKALRFVISKRTAVEDKRKELKADSLAYGRAVDARAKQITEMLQPIESHLKSEKERIDAEKEAIRKREEEEKLTIINTRTLKLINLGMVQTMTEFIWTSRYGEGISTPRINLELFSDEEFNDFLTDFEANKKIDDDYFKVEQEIKKAEQVKLEEDQKKLQEERVKFEKEQADFKSQRAVLRNKILVDLGLTEFNKNWVYIKKSDQQVLNIISFEDVLNLSDERVTLSSEGWEVRLKFIRQEIIKLSKEVKVEDEGLSDKEKFEIYITYLTSFPAPQMSTKKWSAIVQGVQKSLDNYHYPHKILI
jgi:hypothetical protein